MDWELFPNPVTKIALIDTGGPASGLFDAFAAAGLLECIARVSDVDEGLDRLGFNAPAETWRPCVIVLEAGDAAECLRILQGLQAESRTRGIPVVVILQKRDPLLTGDCYDAGANSCLASPEDAHLVEVVRAMADYWLNANVFFQGKRRKATA